MTNIGRLGANAEVTKTPAGKTVTKFRVGCDSGYKKDPSGKEYNGKPVAKTYWINCSLWGDNRTALAQYLTKGKMVFFEGLFDTSEWQDNSGKDRVSLEVTVNTVKLLGEKGAAESVNEESDPPKSDTPF